MVPVDCFFFWAMSGSVKTASDKMSSQTRIILEAKLAVLVANNGDIEHIFSGVVDDG